MDNEKQKETKISFLINIFSSNQLNKINISYEEEKNIFINLH